MKVLLVVKESTLHERIGLMRIAAILRGHSVRIVLSRDLRAALEQDQPAVVGYTAMTGEHLELVRLNRELKRDFRFLAVFGGPHATFYPELIHEEGIDAVCRGEGELAFRDFCERRDYWTTPNFIVKYKGNLYYNSMRPLVDNLDLLPFPDRALMYQADPDLLTESKKTFFSMRGCPYKCTYCFNNKYNQLYGGCQVRNRSPENFVQELKEVKERFPLKVVNIHDDTFSLKPKGWFKTFNTLYKRDVGLPFGCNLRAEHINEELISVLKDTGVRYIWMGVECADEQISNTILQRNLTNRQILNACQLIKKYKIMLVTQNILGIPVKNALETDLKTLDLNIKIRPMFAWSSILFPYPGTPIEKYAREHGFLDELSFTETNKYTSVLNLDHKREIVNLHKLFGLIVQFPFLRPLYKLPLTPLYNALFYLWYGLQVQRMYPTRLIRYAKLWLKMIKKS